MALTPLIPPEVRFAEPTERYRHAVLGDAVEWGALQLVRDREHVVFTYALPPHRVFEDVEPRLASLGDGPENHPVNKVVVVESDLDLGAQLAVYAIDATAIRKVAATPFIGQRNRWLAPAGIADFDGDGLDDIAYVETPHLAGILKIVTLRDGALVPVAAPRAGFSNHRIGEDFITSGVRTCGGGVELILPDRAWSALLAARLEGEDIVTRALPHPPSRDGIDAALRCDD